MGISDQEGLRDATGSRACLEQPRSLSSPDTSGLPAPWVLSRPRQWRVLALLGDSGCSLGGWLMAFKLNFKSVDIMGESTAVPFAGGRGQENYFAF